MEFTISKREFLRGLSRTHSVADRKSSIPILSNILISSNGKGEIRFCATNLYLGVTSLVPASIEKEGSITLPARTIHDIVKNLGEGDIAIKIENGSQCTIQSGKAKYRIPGLPSNDFPSIANPGQAKFHSIDADILAELVALTIYSMSTDDTRPHLAGAKFEGDKSSLRMVTTDGHRLSKAEYTLKEETASDPFDMLLPHKGIFELKRMIEDLKTTRGKSEEPIFIDVAVVAGNAFFKRDGFMLTMKLSDEQFPPYSKVIPQSHKRKIIASRTLLMESLRRIDLVASDSDGAVLLHIEPGNLRIQSQRPDVSEGNEELNIDYAGDPIMIRFNAKYFLDVLTALSSDEIAIELSGELDPAMVKPMSSRVDFVGVVMPMRI